MIVIFAATGVASMMISHVWYVEITGGVGITSGGASGAVCGLLGAAWFAARRMGPGGKDIASAIAKYAEAEKPDFIALATHGRTGFFGGVARSLLKAKIAPLYLVRPNKIDVEANQSDVLARR